MGVDERVPEPLLAELPRQQQVFDEERSSQQPGAYDGIVAYDQSKLTIALVTFELARRLEGAGVTAVCFDPDDIDTKLLREGRPELSAISIVHGATTSVHLTSSPDAEGPTGVYFEDGRETRPLEAVLDRGAQRRIWAEVERLSGRLRV